MSLTFHTVVSSQPVRHADGPRRPVPVGSLIVGDAAGPVEIVRPQTDRLNRIHPAPPVLVSLVEVPRLADIAPERVTFQDRDLLGHLRSGLRTAADLKAASPPTDDSVMLCCFPKKNSVHYKAILAELAAYQDDRNALADQPDPALRGTARTRASCAKT